MKIYFEFIKESNIMAKDIAFFYLYIDKICGIFTIYSTHYNNFKKIKKSLKKVLTFFAERV